MAEPELCHGYCVVCGLYGVGTFAHVISEYSDAVRDHRRCPERGRDGRSRVGPGALQALDDPAPATS